MHCDSAPLLTSCRIVRVVGMFCGNVRLVGTCCIAQKTIAIRRTQTFLLPELLVHSIHTGVGRKPVAQAGHHFRALPRFFSLRSKVLDAPGNIWATRTWLPAATAAFTNGDPRPDMCSLSLRSGL